ncbi:Protein tyrosine phosphatase type IVA 1 [Orchesella cincta]|uniref:Protein tyrosine phosphatase type IVA 1 n=1 Tax=Orchesella cincta TaxID=48709 RepID=A0A1D2NHQ8_ORCCI|nr:Protein tyrosine phosphatase type IVA 1 [Orchesella cincta]
MSSVVRVPGACTEISYKGMRFLITQMPNDIGMNSYVEELTRYKVATLVRVCESTYSPEKLAKNGINCVDLSFPDGQAPPQEQTPRCNKREAVDVPGALQAKVPFEEQVKRRSVPPPRLRNHVN